MSKPASCSRLLEGSFVAVSGSDDSDIMDDVTWTRAFLLPDMSYQRGLQCDDAQRSLLALFALPINRPTFALEAAYRVAD